MKTKLLKSLLAIACLLCSIGIQAHDFEVDGICYNITDNTNKIVEVTEGSYFGTVVIPESVTYQYATYSVTSIGEYAFRYCTGLTSITIPESVTLIGHRAFSDCTGLKEVIIPNSVTSIGDWAFFYCTGLTSITIPDGVTSIGGWTFEYCTSLTDIIIPSSVTSIGCAAFYGCSGLTEIIIPNSVTSIGDAAFQDCIGLTSITISESVTSIGEGAFDGCSGLTSVTIPNSVTSIASGAFQDCIGLTSIIVEDGNTVYDSRENCNAIIETATNTLAAGCQNTVIPNSINTIGSYAFRGCTGLTSVTIPESVTLIGYCAFSDCTSLTSVTIPESVTDIGNYAFENCTSLTSVTIPNSVTSIGSSAFNDTPFYNNQPDGVIYWGLVLYKYKGNMTDNTSIVIKEGIVSISPNAFANCIGLTSVTIPNSVTSIGFDAFSGCTALTSITIPESVTSIGFEAFCGCTALTEITIPCSVTSIGSFAFSGCTGLTLIRIEAVNPPTIQSNTFKEVSKSIPVYVPAGCGEVYRNTEYWNEFTNILEMEGADVVAASIALDNEESDMYIGDVMQLTASVLPDNTTNKVVAWTSSDNEVATVDESGNVTAVSIGSATITATTTDGSNLTASCEVTVKQKKIKLTLQNSYYNNVIFFLTPGTEQEIQIVDTDTRFVLNTVMFNDENVTDQLIDRVYVTPALEEDAVINISYDIPTAQNAPMHNSRIKAYGHRGDVVVVGCKRGESIAIYDVDGVLLRTIFATSDAMRIAMPTGAVYVVKVADAAVKVAL